MTKEYQVVDVVQDKDSTKLVSVTLDLDQYCTYIAAKIFFAVNRVEEITGQRVSEDYLLKSSLFDAIGMIKRLPKNISLVGDDSEEL